MNIQEALKHVEDLLSVAELEGAARPEDYEAVDVLSTALTERDHLLTILAESRRFVAAWTANHESKIGERMLRKIDAALTPSTDAIIRR